MAKTKIKEPKVQITWKEVRRQKVLLIWSAVIVIYGLIFCYLPLAGWAMAFENFRPKDGIFHSQFVGMAKFQQLFSDATFIRVIRNTLAMGVINLAVTFIMAIVFAILLNEITAKGAKKTVQTISYLPHFLKLGFGEQTHSYTLVSTQCAWHAVWILHFNFGPAHVGWDTGNEMIDAIAGGGQPRYSLRARRNCRRRRVDHRPARKLS